ncbi:mannan endo-1,4-beta-mannosidase 2 [Macadamia integrifolia]|uniref:mannan endo-1,4-beta-mannosidase 2 n=1 Tax=Macadamia integrifolia TaxID=60698 RepID=UPI001C52B91D|nr:mannan endo-1,4-beta-mannosidase 2 [Macadamia integrifolia]
MVAGNGLFYPLVGFAVCFAFMYMFLGNMSFHNYELPKMSFVETNGAQFMVDGKVFYVNGWNSYWLMYLGTEDYTAPKVREVLQLGAKMGLTVCRTWAFNDGAYNALQISPGQFDERVFGALDNVIAEARRHGIRLILSLVNNLQNFGGKTQYVKWAWEEGVALSSSNDSFFYDPSIRSYFKNYVKAVLTRKNSVTGIQYRDDPTIFAWELMNEPRCMSDPSGDTLQDWIEEMAGFVKSIDKKHLLTVGLEGFYGPTSPGKLNLNPADWAGAFGTDFIRNSKTPTIDFASVHVYPDHWSEGLEPEEKINFASKWVKTHIEDGDKELKKPIFFTEFGLVDDKKTFQPIHREKFYKTIYDNIYKSAKKKRSGAGACFWQFLVGGMEEYEDGNGIVPRERSSIYKVITDQSCRLARIQGGQDHLQGSLKDICSKMAN